MASTKRSDGEGSIYYDRTRERFIGSYVIGWDGKKPIRKKVSAKSRAGAASKLRELRDKVRAGQLPHGRIPTVAEWMTYWLESIATEANRPSTLAAYGTYVNRYIIPLLGKHRLDKLTPEHIGAAWRVLREEGCPGKENPKPLSPTSVHQAHVILSRALKVAMQRGYATKNVATLMDAPQATPPDVAVLTQAQVRNVIDAAHGKRNAARWTVAFALGLRQGEALGLTWDDVDLTAGTVHVQHSLGRVKGKGLTLGPVKSRKGKRVIVMPGPLLAEMKAHRSAQNAERLAAGSWWRDKGYVFTTEHGAPIDPKADWSAWKALLTEAGAPDVRLHSARHTAATMMLALGVPQKIVSEMLGHSRSDITEGYQHRVDDLHQEAADRMATALWD